MHVLQTQYTLQIIRCHSVECCGPWRSNYVDIFPHRFLPAPVPFERTPVGVRMAEKDYQKGQFYGSLFQRIQFHGVVIAHTQVRDGNTFSLNKRVMHRWTMFRMKCCPLIIAVHR
jgi:hypothetical protein